MTLHRVLALAALGLGGLAALAGTPRRPVEALDVAGLARMVANEEDHVTALELARWIRDRKPGLRVIDVRAASDFDAFHIPTAEHVEISSLASLALAPTDTAVLYSDGGAHAAQAWVLLRASGHRAVFFLRGGLVEWLEDVMDPVLPDDATAAEKAAFEPVADLSHYFGGTPHLGPRTGDAARQPATVEALTAARKRRGC